jgi:hypothetical protein
MSSTKTIDASSLSLPLDGKRHQPTHNQPLVLEERPIKAIARRNQCLQWQLKLWLTVACSLKPLIFSLLV